MSRKGLGSGTPCTTPQIDGQQAKATSLGYLIGDGSGNVRSPVFVVHVSMEAKVHVGKEYGYPFAQTKN